jgi:putative nucleotidyltransferase with HDIG domain
VIKALVFSIQIFSQFEPGVLQRLRLENVWKHSVSVSSWARLISIEAKASNVATDQAYMAGMMHDVGKLVLAVNMQEQYAAFAELVAENPASEVEEEIKMFGASHADVGAYLLGLWGLPDPIVEAVAYHHCPRKSGAIRFAPLVAVHLANALAHTEQRPVYAQNFDREYLLSLQDFNLLECIRNCKKRVEETTVHEEQNSAG